MQHHRAGPAHALCGMGLAGALSIDVPAVEPVVSMTYGSGPGPTHEQLVGLESCNIQASLARSPDHYLIAVVERTGKTACAGECETLKVVRILAARKPDGTAFPEAINVAKEPDSRPHMVFPAGYRAIAVITPVTGRPPEPNALRPFLPDSSGRYPVPDPEDRLPAPYYRGGSGAAAATGEPGAQAAGSDLRAGLYQVRSSKGVASAETQAFYEEAVNRAFSTPRGADCHYRQEIFKPGATPPDH